MTSKSRRSRETLEPQRGSAQGGESISPEGVPKEADEVSHNKCRVAPGPGLPISEEEYQRLKDAARTSTTSLSDNAQEDRPRKRKRS